MQNVLTYIFIDNFNDFNLYKNKFNQSKSVWVSSSPYVINKLFNEGYKIENIENYINKNQINFLMRLSYKLSKKILSINPVKNKFLNQKVYKSMFYRDLAGMIGSYLYKYFLLLNFINQNNSNAQYVFIGNSIKKKTVDHAMSANDNIFFDIAKYLSKNNFKFIENKSNKKNKYSFIFYLKFKVLSILNLNINSFFYKLYKKFFFFKKNSKYKKNIYIFKEVYNFQNNFFKLIKEFNINFLDFEVSNLKFILNRNKNLKITEKIIFFFTKLIKKNKELSQVNFSPVISLIFEQHLQVLKNFETNSVKINNEVNHQSINLKKSDIILSNILERPLSLYFFFKLKNKIKFAFFEHGETSGYQKCWDIRKNSQTILLGNFGFFTHQHGLNVHRKILPKKIITGLCGAHYKYFEKKSLLKKIIIKKILGIPLFKKNVVYVADLFRNNSTYAPYIGRDLDIYNDTLEIINFLKKANKEKTVILKQYPTSLYKDDFKFMDNEITTLNDFNWMHIYYVFDEVYFSAIQSSWLYKNKWQKINIANRPSYPINLESIKYKKKTNIVFKNIKIYKINKIFNTIDKGSWINLIKQ